MMEKKTVLNNVGWRFAEQFLSYAITFIISIIIARLLEPSDYGAIAIIMVFITLANILVYNGFSSSLIQKKDADDVDFSSIFYFTGGNSLLLYGLLYFIAPYVAEYYDQEILCPTLRVLGLRIIFSAVNSVQQAAIARRMEFKKNFYASLGGNISSALIGLAAAFYGLGIWALVIQSLLQIIITSIILWFTVKWRPIWAFSVNRTKRLVSYGWKLTASALVGAIYDDLRTLIIGKVYSQSDLAYYSRGQQFPSVIMGNINVAVTSVFFPVLSRIQDDRSQFVRSNRKMVQVLSGIISPLMVGLAAIAEPLIRLILTDKWIECVPFLQLSCAFYWLTCIYNTYLTSYKAIGNSGLALKLELIDDIIGILLVICFFKISVMAILLVTIFSRLLAFLMSMVMTKKLFNVKYRDQLLDAIAPLIAALIMYLCIYTVSLIPMGMYGTMFIQIIIGILSYVVIAYLVKLPVYNEVKPVVIKR